MRISAAIGIIILAAGVIATVAVSIRTPTSLTSKAIIVPQGKLVIPAQFDSVTDFNDGMASYSTKSSDAPFFTNHGVLGAPLTLDISLGAMGFVDQAGKIYPPIYTLTEDFNDGYASVAESDYRWGVIDRKSAWIVKPTYANLGIYSEGLMSFRASSNKWGFINLQNKVMISPSWDSTGGFYQGRALVCNGSKFRNDSLIQKCGFIDSSGEIVIPLIYDYAEDFNSNLALACKGIGSKQRCGYLNLDGSVAFALTIPDHQDSFAGDWLPNLSSFYNGFATVGGNYFQGIEKWGLLNNNLKQTIPLMLNKELPAPFSSRLTSSFSSDPWYLDTDIQWEVVGATKIDPGRAAGIDTQGNIKFFSTYRQVLPFSQGISAVKIGNKWGFINEKNVLVIPAQYQAVHPYSGGLAAVEINNKWGFIN